MKKITFFGSVIALVIIITSAVTAWFCFKLFYQIQVESYQKNGLFRPIVIPEDGIKNFREKVTNELNTSGMEKIKQAKQWMNKSLEKTRDAARDGQKKLEDNYKKIMGESSKYVGEKAENIKERWSKSAK